MPEWRFRILAMSAVTDVFAVRATDCPSASSGLDGTSRDSNYPRTDETSFTDTKFTPIFFNIAHFVQSCSSLRKSDGRFLF